MRTKYTVLVRYYKNFPETRMRGGVTTPRPVKVDNWKEMSIIKTVYDLTELNDISDRIISVDILDTELYG